jgi:hypothetical protein
MLIVDVNRLLILTRPLTNKKLFSNNYVHVKCYRLLVTRINKQRTPTSHARLTVASVSAFEREKMRKKEKRTCCPKFRIINRQSKNIFIEA